MKSLSDRLIIEEHNGVKIISLTFTGLREGEIIELIQRHMELSLQTRLPFLIDLKGSFLTPNVMVHGKKFAELTRHIVDRGALIGVDRVKSLILKGVVFLYGVNYKAFETREQAIEFLTSIPENT